MNPGRLSDVITLKYPVTSSADSFGQVITTFATSSKWAEITRKSGDETEANGVSYTRSNLDILMRNEGDITIDESCKVEYEGKTYDVTWYDYLNYTNKRYVKLTAQLQKE